MYTTYESNLNKLDKIQNQCGIKNWNGYGAEAVPTKIIDFCKRVILNLGTQPEIFPTADQSIQLEYDKKSEYMDIEIFEKSISVYKEHKDGTEENYQIEYGINPIVDEVQKYLYNIL